MRIDTNNVIIILLCTEGFNRVFFAGGAGRNETANEGKNNGENDKPDGVRDAEVGSELFYAGETDEDGVNDRDSNEGECHGNKAREKADNEGFSIEDAGDVVLAGSKCAKDADLLGSFVDGNVGDNTNHDGTDDEGDGDESNKNICDGVDDGLNAVGEDAGGVGVFDLLLFCVLGIVCFDQIKKMRFAVKTIEEDGDAGGRVEILIAKRVEVTGECGVFV